ncbi:uncharacterized protein BXIN_1252 [Babesia sp. Xinjiang]|uniref:uncharacterized protein n=1 Tax=Babesia sp. Xinjiang TaxID=462227 RepID=UPI000A241B35|nr:uncharacterized protein BXIN_1252 [Babesia sp. Xinjiang]ORM39980.1 hypothetical protein BXIN_1252 [Babesia sp. Xinjiang]
MVCAEKLERHKMFLRGTFGIPVPQLAILLLGVLTAVTAEKVEGSETLTLGQKLARLSNGEKLFALLGSLSLICFFVATGTTLVSPKEKIRFTPSVEPQMPKPRPKAVVYVFLVLGSIFLILFVVCGCCLYHADGSVTLCQKGCLCLGILLFVCSLLLVVLEIFLHTEPDKDEDVVSAYYSENAFVLLFLIFFIAFIFGVCRQCNFKRPLSTCQMIFIVLGVLVAFSLIMATASIIILRVTLASYANLRSNEAESEQEEEEEDTSKTTHGLFEVFNFSYKSIPIFISLYFIFTTALLSLSCYMGFFGQHFNLTEVAFGTLGILVILCFVLLILYVIGDYHDEPEAYAILATQCVLLIPFLYCGYRLGLFDYVTAFFKGGRMVGKANPNNLVGDVSGSSRKVVKTEN